MFFKKRRGALWVCLWNQGGRWTEKVWEPLVYNIENQLSSGLCPSSWIKYKIYTNKNIKPRRFGRWFFFRLLASGILIAMVPPAEVV
jgi:hypothetical protein